MAREKEIKIRLKNISFKDFIKRIKEHGFKKEAEISQTDIYFDKKDWLLYENLAASRLRIVNGKDYSFSFKKIFYRPKLKGKYYIEEIEAKFPINDYKPVKAIFDRMLVPYNGDKIKDRKSLTKYLKRYDYLDSQIMPKTRQIFKNDSGDEIVIDNVDKVGLIIELECLQNEPLDVVKTFLSKNEWERSLEGTGFIWLKNVKGLNSHIKNLDRFKEDPYWNVWKVDELIA